MGMHVAIVVIEGNHVAEMSKVFGECGFAFEGSKVVETAKKATSAMANGAKVAYFLNGLTFIVDPEMVLFSDDVWLKYSKKWNCRIIGCICESTSATFGLALYQSGKQPREIVSSDGNVVSDKGKPLAEESGVDWTEATEDSVFQLAERLGAKYFFPAKADYTVFEGESEE